VLLNPGSSPRAASLVTVSAGCAPSTLLHPGGGCALQADRDGTTRKRAQALQSPLSCHWTKGQLTA